MTPQERIIVALDVPDLDQARALIGKLGDSVGVYKIGLELIFAGGLALGRALADNGKRVFLDAKLLDIEATVERATAAIAKTGAHSSRSMRATARRLTPRCAGGATAP